MADTVAAYAVRRFGYSAERLAHCQVLENPLAPWKVRLIGGRSELRFRSGLRVPVSRSNLDLGWKLIDLAYEGAPLTAPPAHALTEWPVDLGAGTITTPSGIRLTLESLHPVIFAETFLYDIHFSGYDLSGKTVVDVGSNVGDTPLYFANYGARVVGFEPDPENRRLLAANLDLNPALMERIRVRPEAVGKDETVTFRAGRGGASGMYRSDGAPVTVRSISLDTLLAEEAIAQPYLLKADCKGAEYDLVEQKGLEAFQKLAIEYSAERPGGTPDRLLTRLRERGYSKIRLFKHNAGYFPLTEYGTIFAER